MRIRSLILGLFAIVLLVLLLGCATSPDAPQPPLGTSGTVAPPAGCIDLRRRGGSC